ncbi:MAG: Gmad2 immunoglobulin-like domain-containing protein [Patescibacteria group bacterium]
MVTKKRSLSNRQRLFLGAVVVVLVGVGVYSWVNRDPVPKQKTPVATIKKLPAATTNTGEKELSGAASNNQGTATPNQNPQAVTTKPNQWISSESGVIVVQQPIKDQTIKSGATLSGTASVGQIQYRLIDDSSGVISQGIIDVSNGKYSVALGFSPKGSSGRLDVFSISASGNEINEVQIAIKF